MKDTFAIIFAILQRIIGITLAIIIVCLLAKWLCTIDANETHYWYHGILHGLFVIPNIIRHFFDSDILIKAELCTSAYSFFFWTSAIYFGFRELLMVFIAPMTD